ncbi:uncharacterized protein [Primulina eburnea]|uniref:uncharacterized protein n=1 Tax=Primulina eburnea TaxID=1245227 RepID=UPI003C6C3A05
MSVHWFRWMKVKNSNLTWERFAEGHIKRYSGRKAANPVELLASLKQNQKPVETYVEQFEALLSQIGDLPEVQVPNKPNDATYCISAKTNWDEAIIITRGRVNVSWDQVVRVLGNDVKRRIKILPFQANKAVWWPAHQKEREHFTQLKRGFFEGGVALDFENWRPDINSSELVLNCCNSWIKIAGLPWHLWTTDIFNIIGEQCGGLLEISKDTTILRDLGAAKIKVKGKRDGFISNRVRLPINGIIKEFINTVDTFDRKAYELYGKQTYAQALINGKRTSEGGINNNINKDKPGCGEPTRCIAEVRQEVEDIGQTIRTTERANHNSVRSDNLKDRKVEKILKRLSPKKIEDFNSSPIHSLSNGQGEENHTKSTADVHSKQSKDVHNNTSNFNNNINFSTGLGNGGDPDFIQELEDLSKTGECDFNDTADFDSQQLEDDQMLEGSDYSEADSIFSSQSEMRHNQEAVDLDLQELFQQNEEVEPLKQTAILESTEPIVGKSSGLLGGGQSLFPDKLGSERDIQLRLGESNEIKEPLSPPKKRVSLSLEKEVLKSSGKLSRELVRLQSGINYEKGSASKGPNRLL